MDRRTHVVGSPVKMIRNILVLLICVCVVSHASTCVKETFDRDTLNVSFSENSSICTEIPTVMWKTRRYFDTKVTPPHEHSVAFIYPETTLTCMSTFKFRMEPMGTVEVNVFMDAIATTDQIIVLSHQSVSGMTDILTGMVALTPLGAGYVRGWQTLKLTIGGTAPHDGHISFMGMASGPSIVLIDSFRYIPPGTSESDCELYELETTVAQTSTEWTTETILWPTDNTDATELPTESTTEWITETTTVPVSSTTPKDKCKKKRKLHIDWERILN